MIPLYHCLKLSFAIFNISNGIKSKPYLQLVAIFKKIVIFAEHAVQFVSSLADTVANVGEPVELSCKLSSEKSKGRWYKNGKPVSQLTFCFCSDIPLYLCQADI